MNVSIPVLLLALASTAVIMGCSSDKPANAPDPATTGEAVDKPAATKDGDFPGKDPNKADIRLGPKLSKLCEMPNAQFGYDSANLSKEASDSLDKLATCFKTGAAKDVNMKLIGHADPRGEEEYNFALGQRRAASVESHLKNRGVGTDRMTTTSRGELDATGTDEDSWAKDRTVEIFIAE